MTASAGLEATILVLVSVLISGPKIWSQSRSQNRTFLGQNMVSTSRPKCQPRSLSRSQMFSLGVERRCVECTRGRSSGVNLPTASSPPLPPPSVTHLLAETLFPPTLSGAYSLVSVVPSTGQPAVSPFSRCCAVYISSVPKIRRRLLIYGAKFLGIATRPRISLLAR